MNVFFKYLNEYFSQTTSNKPLQHKWYLYFWYTECRNNSAHCSFITLLCHGTHLSLIISLHKIIQKSKCTEHINENVIIYSQYTLSSLVIFKFALSEITHQSTLLPYFSHLSILNYIASINHFSVGTWCNSNVIRTPKRRHDVILTSWRNFDVIMTLLLHHVSPGITICTSVMKMNAPRNVYHCPTSLIKYSTREESPVQHCAAVGNICMLCILLTFGINADSECQALGEDLHVLELLPYYWDLMLSDNNGALHSFGTYNRHWSLEHSFWYFRYSYDLSHCIYL